MSSWPFLFAAALAIWLLLKGPAAKKPLFVQKVCRIATAFFVYCGFLYLLKWNPFWKGMLSLGFESRNNAEGFLILLSTIVWLIATFRIAFRGLRFRALRGASGNANHVHVTQAPHRLGVYPAHKTGSKNYGLQLFHFPFPTFIVNEPLRALSIVANVSGC